MRLLQVAIRVRVHLYLSTQVLHQQWSSVVDPTVRKAPSVKTTFLFQYLHLPNTPSSDEELAQLRVQVDRRNADLQLPVQMTSKHADKTCQLSGSFQPTVY